MNVSKYLEADIKAVTINHLLASYDLHMNGFLINELTLDKYSRRVDLVWVRDKELFAFEIKSDSDSLARLNAQVSKYLEHFDKVIVIAASKHISQVLETVPANVSVWEFNKGVIRVRQRGKKILIRHKERLFSFLKKNELVKLSKQFAISSAINMQRQLLETFLLKLPLCKIRQFVIHSLSKRYQVTYNKFFDTVNHGEVLTQHIDLLSMYKEQRKIYMQNIKQSEVALNSLKAVNEVFFLDALYNDQQIFGSPPEALENLIKL